MHPVCSDNQVVPVAGARGETDVDATIVGFEFGDGCSNRSSTDGARRRRGPALEEALLDAAWTELTERGYDDMTIDAVAVRAGTSRAVLYRRWPNKQELVLATLAHEVRKRRRRHSRHGQPAW
jgi:hypothetical protein